ALQRGRNCKRAVSIAERRRNRLALEDCCKRGVLAGFGCASERVDRSGARKTSRTTRPRFHRVARQTKHRIGRIICCRRLRDDRKWLRSGRNQHRTQFTSSLVAGGNPAGGGKDSRRACRETIRSSEPQRFPP